MATRIDDCGMAEVFLSDEHVGFLRTCLGEAPPAYLETRVGKEVKSILDELDRAFQAKKLDDEPWCSCCDKPLSMCDRVAGRLVDL